ncbi:adenosylmethionine--8-amino-7-oxononanoate transaminase [Stomatohabitans albus]|uniref:adenosylmethionine--8-amino-7-oxononanoate transaminase n=1 Tax=Stomatohabitans albus TaxID=3110766 RepID=UPI00300D39D4
MNTLTERDAAAVWHPYAPMPPAYPAYPVIDAHEVYLTLEDGREVIDAMSSWWCMVHGYRHPVMSQAIKDQVDRFSHVMFGGLTHEPAIRLCEELLALAPSGFAHVFLADSGSVAVEVALKLARQQAITRSPQGTLDTSRMRLATLRGGYHGDTWGAMGVCDPEGGMHALYGDALGHQVFLPRPPAGYGRTSDDPALQTWAGDVSALIEAHRNELCGIVLEPVLQGAGGMYIYSPEVLRILRAIADDQGLVLIFDEIATGFGRTGQWWGASHADVVPDIMCVGKALTGGYMTQAAVLVTSQVAERLRQSPSEVLMHGPTFMGNPLACAASLASIGLLRTEDWKDQVAMIETRLHQGLSPLITVDAVADVRILGAVGVVELHHPIDVPRLTATALDAGVWVRPFGKLLYTMPPYIAQTHHIDTITAAMAIAVEHAERQ